MPKGVDVSHQNVTNCKHLLSKSNFLLLVDFQLQYYASALEISTWDLECAFLSL